MRYQNLDDREVIKVTGIDATNFLQSFITNDITMAHDSVIYTLLLSPKGKYLFDFFIFGTKFGFLIDIAKHLSQGLIARLNLYKLNSKLDIDVLHDFKVIYSEEKISSADYSFKDPRFSKLGFRTVTHIDMPQGNINDPKLYYNHKYQFAIPDDLDFIQDKSFPLEYGMDKLNAISFNKGCYVGQEVISRTKNLGVVRKFIYKLDSKDSIDNISKGSELKISNSNILSKDNSDVNINDDGSREKIGITCSTYNNSGIALVWEENYLSYKDKEIICENVIVNLSKAEWYI